ncbi:BTB/POZ domain-containing protein [Rhizophagus irregularis DAOM 181602=DAOM 197198]|uniref:Uncharacterized protein n=2 Tax=Rhizophagus irregularis TaxID=588596 RepID=U9TDX5_RHIID|nr:hypothetical protein GLOIN_2v1841271 [Rhizophagus irregularis DAOM 181602=DAOM 197198]EXX73015.1 hypothetical protein RirG_064070 [Rhizophagus irregularis DAOM 197198w]POG71158.1 hypothetical protein GLOIN_2v1841271 [Rhizophagus irregularis DAOM 181602=DAOM 197198]GBC37681.1 BTB/POZ domain-containing protein [Rhizophagus irregularis DAOM 181602=DAOM 197198]|eukprot:XP_025178024.1 hypothetical protein GLOIN_2v1841271 [Rhizophagus irregularis DAOM 181602=DAOM 197198]
MQYNLTEEKIKIIQSLGKLLKNGTDHNVIIHIGEYSNSKKFLAHTAILRYRSDYFNKILSEKNIKKEGGKYIIKKPNITPQAFEVILEYLYIGEINITNKTGTELLNIMFASKDLKLEELAEFIKEFIINHHHLLLQNDPVGILQIVNDNNTFIKIKEFCIEKICSEPEILFKSDKFTQLSASLLEIILKRNDLNLDEIEIWDNLIKWGSAQEDREIKNFFKFIRFYDISSEDYIMKVKEYLPEELRADLLRFYMIPGHEPECKTLPRRIVDSVIINRKHVEVFADWIDKKNSWNVENNNGTINYKFNLLYRGSRDGNTIAEVRKKCNNKGATIIVIKIKDSEQVVGGYSPIGWDSSDTYKSSANSFIFTIPNRKNIQTAKLVYGYDDPYSILCRHFAIFGYNDYNRNWNVNNPFSSPKFDGIPKGNLYMDDYEIIQVVEKTSVSKNNLENTSLIKSTVENFGTTMKNIEYTSKKSNQKSILKRLICGKS